MSAPTEDKMTLEVLEDGTARLEVDGISGANHVKADALVREFAKLMGGEPTIQKRPRVQTRTKLDLFNRAGGKR